MWPPVTPHWHAGYEGREAVLSPDEDQIGRLLRVAAAAGLAGVVQSVSYGTPSLKVGSKFLARLKDPLTLVVRCPVDEKEMLMAAEPHLYFQTDHYVGYDAMLVRLDAIDDAALGARLERAWLMQAGKRAVAARRVNVTGRVAPR